MCLLSNGMTSCNVRKMFSALFTRPMHYSPSQSIILNPAKALFTQPGHYSPSQCIIQPANVLFTSQCLIHPANALFTQPMHYSPSQCIIHQPMHYSPSQWDHFNCLCHTSCINLHTRVIQELLTLSLYLGEYD